ncbi:hypothetical protein AKJ45_00675 [candidate division MSBL1 archaeon SCGC-AAA261F19]|uniref:DDH domain-containing protein n=1 Tax=candidate division MSBL1 archaeon SCGC-AAA261F19 TaxID=1698275 RepID=A0A133VBE8_9EURY|nr:hypothetical protein AKJ45_00675 [candidate division MSBL1 archaeon SCGC-AAA261F19]
MREEVNLVKESQEMRRLAKYLVGASKNSRLILVIGHPHADPDTIGCVVALSEALEQLGAEVQSGVPGNLSKLAKSVLSSVGREIVVDPPVDADLVIIVDTSTLGQLKELEEKISQSGAEIVIIDHHRPSEGAREIAKFYLVDEEATSTAELVLKLIQEMGAELSSDAALLLLTAVISDTGHFRFANSETFTAVSNLLERGANYMKALDALETPEDLSKRVAMLKAAERAKIYKFHGRYVVFTKIGAFESDAASMFVKIGADVALAGGGDEEGIRISARSRSGVASETCLHLGELMSQLADTFNGTGGGHAGAAAMSAKADLDEVKEEALKILNDMLRGKEN